MKKCSTIKDRPFDGFPMHVKRQSHHAYDQVTTNVRSKIVRIVLTSQKQPTTGLRGRRRSY